MQCLCEDAQNIHVHALCFTEQGVKQTGWYGCVITYFLQEEEDGEKSNDY